MGLDQYLYASRKDANWTENKERAFYATIAKAGFAPESFRVEYYSKLDAKVYRPAWATANLDTVPAQLAIAAAGLNTAIDEEYDYLGNPKDTRWAQIGYWRKANMVHGFIEHEVCDCAEDDKTFATCAAEHTVSRAQLTDLKERCEKILANHDLAEDLLPPMQGFFFGSYEIDDWYFQDLEDTVGIVTKALALPEGIDISYDSSW